MIGRLLRLLFGVDSSSQQRPEPRVQHPAVETTAAVVPQQSVPAAPAPAAPPQPSRPGRPPVAPAGVP
ncbi:MAG: dihydrolipoamide acetyltransferase, partial [bacterium]